MAHLRGNNVINIQICGNYHATITPSFGKKHKTSGGSIDSTAFKMYSLGFLAFKVTSHLKCIRLFYERSSLPTIMSGKYTEKKVLLYQQSHLLKWG